MGDRGERLEANDQLRRESICVLKPRRCCKPELNLGLHNMAACRLPLQCMRHSREPGGTRRPRSDVFWARAKGRYRRFLLQKGQQRLCDSTRQHCVAHPEGPFRQSHRSAGNDIHPETSEDGSKTRSFKAYSRNCTVCKAKS